jgi:FkbM family methyltransferase
MNGQALSGSIDESEDRKRSLFGILENLSQDKATVEDIGYCFRLILGRPPHPEEWDGHTSLAGTSLTSVVRSYIASAEFSNRNLLTAGDVGKLIETVYPEFRIFTLDDDVSVGANVASGRYETHVQDAFRRFLRAGDTILDVGANIGFFTMLAASLVGGDGKVIAVEPNRRNVRLLEASRRTNNFSQIEIHNVAAHHEPATLVLNASYSNGTVSALSDDIHALMLSEIVPAQKIDTIVDGRKVDFIKIDVEGAEMKALKGGVRTLVAHRPVIVSEFSHTGIHEGGEAYLSWLADLGYKFAVLDGSERAPEFTSDRPLIIDAFERSGVHHIDIIAAHSEGAVASGSL